jgi:hypothetical protein
MCRSEATRSTRAGANGHERERAASAESFASNGFDAETGNWLSSTEQSSERALRGRTLCRVQRAPVQRAGAMGRATGGCPFDDETQCADSVRCDPLDPRKPSAMRREMACLCLRLEPLQLTVCDLGGDSPSRPGARGRSPSPQPLAPPLAQSFRPRLGLRATAPNVGVSL